jgi:hypothetical protein
MASPDLQIVGPLAWDTRRGLNAWASRLKVYSMAIIAVLNVIGDRPALNAPLFGVRGR